MTRFRKVPSLTLAAGVLLLVGEARPDGACCFEDGGCLFADSEYTCATTWGGRYPGYSTDCDDTDNDGIADDCREGPFDITFPKLYWLAGRSSTGRVQRANLDGSQVETVAFRSPLPYSLAIDGRSQRVYWIDRWGQMNRATLDGTDRTVLFTDNDAEQVVVDEVDRKLYWTAQGIIKRANLDGGNIEIVLSGNDPIDIAVVHDPRKACTYVDADADGDVDLYDFAAFQECFGMTGP